MKLLDAMGMAYKLGAGYPSYASMAPTDSGTLSTSKIYSQPWLHVAQSSPTSAPLNIFDTYFDKK